MAGYRDGAALRAALEARLKRRAQQTRAPLDRLRKEVANGRFLARFAAAPSGSWALKGGLALIARIGDEARATKDADMNWRRTRNDLDDLIGVVVDVDLNDFFEFEIKAPRELEAESPEGGLRYHVTARLGGREFERLQLDVNLVPDDPRPFEHVSLRNPLAFAGLDAPSIPTVCIELGTEGRNSTRSPVPTSMATTPARRTCSLCHARCRPLAACTQCAGHECGSSRHLRHSPYTVAPYTWASAAEMGSGMGGLRR
ncbi:MAG: nucleotidyl transferase AbiEii/AbiGii toxin family protein [Egibacteraceae bacterium]